MRAEGGAQTRVRRGDLRIESLQGTSTYRESSQQVGGSVTIGMSAGGGSVSISKSKIDSNYESVNEQSAIRAGDGGFQINVDGTTELIGGAVTSTQAAVDNERNEFKSEGGLSTSDIQNRAEYNASGFSISSGTGGGSPSGGAGIGSDSGSDSSVTQAAISGVAGNTDARTGDAETGLNPIFDQERVKEEVNAQVAITAAFGQQASKAVGNYATRKYNELKASDPEEAAKWAEGGEYRSLAHAVVGGLSGGLAGAAGAGAAALSADALNKLTQDMPEGVRNAVGAAVAAGIGAIAGGTAGAATAFNADVNNRQLHPNERVLAKHLAAKSGGRYTTEEIENAMRNAGNTRTGESVVAGMVVDPAQRDAIYDSGTVWTTGENGWLAQVLPPQPNAELATFIKQNTGETYNWYTPSSEGVSNDPGIPRDRLTGQPLDSKGRYSQTVVLDGKAFEPKYFPCATAECIRTGANLNTGDAASQTYIKALDSQIFKDIGKGATVGSLATPVGVVGATLGILGMAAATGQVAMNERPSDAAIDATIQALSQKGGEAFLRDVLGHSGPVAIRAAALVELAGGWSAFSERVKTDLLEMKANEQTN